MVLSDVAYGNFLGLTDIIPENNKYVLNQRMGLLRKKDRNANLKFLQIYINKKQRYFKLHGQGSSQQNLSKGDILKFKISLPEVGEQQKIASFLTAVDEKITKLEEKKKGFEKYKKGVMRAIFSHGSTSSPHGKIRFKKSDGSNYPDWEEKKLGEIGEIVGGGTPDTSNQENWNGEIYWLTPTEVKTKYICQSLRMITKQGLQSSSARLLPIGTIIFTSRATVGDVGISTVEMTTNQGFQSIVINNKNCNEFIYYWIKSNRKQFLRKASGSTFLEISKKEMVKIKGVFPVKEEQEKIAEFLTSLDNKVDFINKELQQARLFKKALLQRMFV